MLPWHVPEPGLGGRSLCFAGSASRSSALSRSRMSSRSVRISTRRTISPRTAPRERAAAEAGSAEARLELAGTDDFIVREARRLGFVRPGERLFIVNGVGVDEGPRTRVRGGRSHGGRSGSSSGWPGLLPGSRPVPARLPGRHRAGVHTDDGTPFPTTFWLTPLARRSDQPSRGSGRRGRWSAAAVESPELAESLAHATAEQRRLRPQLNGGIAGTRDPTRLCVSMPTPRRPRAPATSSRPDPCRGTVRWCPDARCAAAGA